MKWQLCLLQHVKRRGSLWVGLLLCPRYVDSWLLYPYGVINSHKSLIISQSTRTTHAARQALIEDLIGILFDLLFPCTELLRLPSCRNGATMLRDRVFRKQRLLFHPSILVFSPLFNLCLIFFSHMPPCVVVSTSTNIYLIIPHPLCFSFRLLP